jgi:hypothetical protein
VIVRYYIIDKYELQFLNLGNGKRRKRILSTRPTPWSLFFQGLFRLNKDLAFVHLPDKVVEAFVRVELAAVQQENTLKINAHSAEIEEWNFFTLCKFCLEGIQFRTFQRVGRWRW